MKKLTAGLMLLLLASCGAKIEKQACVPVKAFMEQQQTPWFIEQAINEAISGLPEPMICWKPE